jgi:phage terminase large subunit GpA-like protein
VVRQPHRAQLGLNWVGYAIHHAPGPMMIVWPTTEMAQRNSKHRIDPLIEESPVLREIIAPARSRDSGNTVLMKEFRGGVLAMTGANSAVGLRSMPVRYLFLDEVDAYPLDVDGEGDAIHLAEARTRTFARRKILLVSTPTIAGASIIEREYEASDQRRYFVPCPHCAHRQWLRFERLRWEPGRPQEATYVCEACEEPIAEHHKPRMLELGQWQAQAESRTAGFHLGVPRPEGRLGLLHRRRGQARRLQVRWLERGHRRLTHPPIPHPRTRPRGGFVVLASASRGCTT